MSSVPAAADSMSLSVTGNAYDAHEFSGFSLAGPGLSIDVSNDFGPPNMGGLVPGQTYELSYAFDSATFNGQYDGAEIAGNGSINWQFTITIPNDPGTAMLSLMAPGTVSGQFSFCTPANYEPVSSCGPADNPLGSATFNGTGMDTADLVCVEAGTCSIYADYLEPFSAEATLDPVPEPPTIVLLLGAMLLLPVVVYLRRGFSRDVGRPGPG